MMRRQERREDRREDRGPGGPAGAGGGDSHYKIREKMFTIGDDFWIETGAGRRAFKVDGKALRVRQTLVFESPAGAPLLRIQEKMMRVKDTMDVEDPNGRPVATVKKALIAPLRERYTVSVAGGPDLEVQGNLLDHEYTITRGRDRVAEISKKWFRIADTYGVEIDKGENDILMLAICVCIDQMSHDVG